MIYLVRLLLVSALAWALVGCSSASQQTHQSFADRGLYQAHRGQSAQIHSKRDVLLGRTVAAKSRYRKNIHSTKIAKSNVASSFIRLHDNSNIGMTTPSNAAKTETPPSSQLDDETVIKKAKATIAAKMSDSNSVEFERIERGVSENALGNSIDTICGYVRDKNSGPKLFLYIVQKDEAYVGGYPIATSQFRNICAITKLGR